jgi:hypothetical protein
MFSKNVSRRKRAMFTQFSSIRIASGLGKYLGFPFVQGQVKRADFNFIFDKISRRLVDWKNRLLNKAGKLTLARSVMSTIPIYPMQNYWLPQATCMVIDRVVRNFILYGTIGSQVMGYTWSSGRLLHALGVKEA